MTATAKAKPDALRARLAAVQARLDAGDLEGAVTASRAALALDPAHAALLQTLGRVLVRLGRDAEALEPLAAACAAAPRTAAVHADLAAALQNLGRDAAAAAAAQAALALEPGHVAALNALGNALRGLGRADEAVACFDRALVRAPDAALLHLNRAGALRRLGDVAEAAAACERAVALAPGHADAHLMLGVLAREAGRHEAALRALLRTVELRPAFAPAHHALGTVLAALGEDDAAAAAFGHALELDPAHVDSHVQLGRLARTRGRLDAAHAQFAAAVERAPDAADARLLLAEVCAARGAHEDAAEHFERAAALAPGRGEAWNGLGNARRALGNAAEAERAYRAALAAVPELAEARVNLANLALDRGAHAAAIEHAWHALALDPALADAHLVLAQAHLARGDLERGWPEYEHRRHVRGAAEPEHPYPRWRGGPSAGATVLVTAEQGVGDEVLFASCVPDLLATGATCVLECDARLAALFERSFPGVRTVARLAAPADYPATLPRPDAWIAAGSLPGRFRGEEAAFPAHDGYLRAAAARVADWRRRCDALGARLTVGIAWRGGKEALVRRARSIALRQWTPLARGDVALVSLQYGEVAAEIDAARAAGIRVHSLDGADPLRDLDEHAALIAALDLVVTVDGATAHLAGALGVPALVLLPHVADWRWFEGREDSPWYPSLRLLRQPRPGAWDEVLERAAGEIAMGAAHPARDRARTRTPRAAHRPPRARVALVNDTSHGHPWGRAASGGALIAQLESRGAVVHRVPARGVSRAAAGPRTLEEFDDPAVFGRFAAANPWLLRDLERAEHVVVNGGGSLHGTGPSAMNLLYVAYAARVHLGRTVRLVNHSCHPGDPEGADDAPAWNLYRKVHGALERAVVREPASHELLARAGIATTLGGDCLALAAAEHARGRTAARRAGIVIAGSGALPAAALGACAAFVRARIARGATVAVLTDTNLQPAAREQEFARALLALAPGTRVLEAASVGAWFEALVGAELLVSDRFHHTLAAAAFGTPFVLLGGAVPRSAGLARVTGARRVLDAREPELAATLDAAADEALAAPPDDGAARRTALVEAAWRNVDELPWCVADRVAPGPGAAP